MTLLVACASPGGGSTETEGSQYQPGDAWAEPGWGKELFHPISAGDDYPIILGGQGAYMFTLTLHAGGFALPAEGVSPSDPSWPHIDASVDIEGWTGELDPRGHFSSVEHIPVEFRELEDGSYEYIRLALLLPENLLVFDDILGAPLTLRYRLDCGDGQFLEEELPLVVALGD